MKKLLLSIIIIISLNTSFGQCTASQVRLGANCFVLLTGFAPSSTVGLIPSGGGAPILVTINATPGATTSVALPSCFAGITVVGTASQSGGGCSVDIINSQPLPLKLTNTSITKVNEGNKFTFTATNELVGTTYTLLKSKDGITFSETTGSFIVDNNNIKPNATRSLIDNQFQSKMYYRVSATELTGQKVYSNILKIEDIENGASIYPNPAQKQITLSVSQKYVGGSYQIYTLSGAKVKEQKITNNTQQIEIASLLAGTYSIRLSNNGYTQSILLNKQ